MAYPDSMRAQGNYADVINRTVDRYADTPNGAPPGVIIEGILQTQAKPDIRMSTGSGVPQGISGLALDSEDMRLFQERYGREAEMWNPEEAIDLVANSTNARQEMGGLYADWIASAFAVTGAIDHTGLKPGLTDEQKQKAQAWFSDYATFLGDRQRSGNDAQLINKLDALQPGSIVLGTNAQGQKEFSIAVDADFSGNPHYQKEWSNASSSVKDWATGIPGAIADATGISSGVSAIVGAVSSWLPRIGFFLVGAVLLLIGVWLLARPGAPGGKPSWRK